MAEVALLFEKLFGKCTNGVLPNLKLVAALKNLHKRQPLYHRKDDIETWAPAAGGAPTFCVITDSVFKHDLRITRVSLRSNL